MFSSLGLAYVGRKPQLIRRGKPPALPEDAKRFDLYGGRVGDVDVMNFLPFKGVRRDEEKVRWTFSPPNGCNAFLHPGGHTRRGMVFF